MLTVKAETQYGLRSLVYLAERPDEFCSVARIAHEENISAQFLEKILPQFVTAGLVKVQRGANGGYQLAKAPGDIVLEKIIATTEGELNPVPCLQEEDKCKKIAPSCSIKRFWQNLQQDLLDSLEGVTLADLLSNE